MRAIFSSKNDLTATPAVGRNECGPEDQVAVMELVFAVPRMGTGLQEPGQAALLFWGLCVCVAWPWGERG